MMHGHGLMYSNMYSPDKPKSQRRVDWRRVGGLFAPYWRQQTAVLACILVTSLLGLIPAFVTAHIIDTTIPSKDMRQLALDVGIILASALISAGIGVAQGYLNSVVGEGIMRDIRSSLVSHLHKMPLVFFTGTKTGEIMNRVSSDVDNIDNVVTGTLTSIVTNIAIIVTTVVAMFIWNWRLALLSILIVPLMIVPLGPVGRKMYQIRKKTREKRDEIESITQETLSISGITLIKSFAREAYEKRALLRRRHEPHETRDRPRDGGPLVHGLGDGDDRHRPGAGLAGRRLAGDHGGPAGRRHRRVRQLHPRAALRTRRDAGRRSKCRSSARWPSSSASSTTST